MLLLNQFRTRTPSVVVVSAIFQASSVCLLGQRLAPLGEWVISMPLATIQMSSLQPANSEQCTQKNPSIQASSIILLYIDFYMYRIIYVYPSIIMMIQKTSKNCSPGRRGSTWVDPNSAAAVRCARSCRRRLGPENHEKIHQNHGKIHENHGENLSLLYDDPEIWNRDQIL